MVSQLLTLPDAELDQWRHRIVDTVGASMVPSIIALLDPEVRRPLDLGSLIGDTPARSAVDPSHRSALWSALHSFAMLIYGSVGNVIVIQDDVRSV